MRSTHNHHSCDTMVSSLLNYIEYDGEGGGTFETYHDYLRSLETLLELLHRKTMPGGRLVINIANMHSRRHIEGASYVYPIVADIIGIATRVRFIFFDELIWIKGNANTGVLNGSFLFGSYPYPPTPKILNTIFEYILVFKKEGKREAVTQERKEKSKIDRLQWRKWTKGIWEIPPDRESGHPASFPIAVAERIVRLYSFVDDVVLDPFAGSGTTVVAAERHQRKGIGFEIAIEYKQSILDKTAKWINQLTLPGL